MLVGLPTSGQIRSAHSDRGGAREALAKARAMLLRYPDSGIFPEPLEHQEGKLRMSKQHDGAAGAFTLGETPRWAMTAPARAL